MRARIFSKRWRANSQTSKMISKNWLKKKAHRNLNEKTPSNNIKDMWNPNAKVSSKKWKNRTQMPKQSISQKDIKNAIKLISFSAQNKPNKIIRIQSSLSRKTFLAQWLMISGSKEPEPLSSKKNQSILSKPKIISSKINQNQKYN